jgi:hypothetical protein
MRFQPIAFAGAFYLGLAAVGTMASPHESSELFRIKSTYEKLETRVQNLEKQSLPPAAVPAGPSGVFYGSGQGALADWAKEPGEPFPADSGLEIAIAPSAGHLAPLAQLVVYGYVKADLIYHFERDLVNKGYLPYGITRPDTNIRLLADDSKLGIKTRFTTPAGEIRTLIDGGFLQDPDSELVVEFERNADGRIAIIRSVTVEPRPAGLFHMGKMYGEWDVSPNWTLLVGRTSAIAALPELDIPTVAGKGTAGPLDSSDQFQARATYHSGLWSLGVGVDRATFDSETAFPDFSGFVSYRAEAGHELYIKGTVVDMVRAEAIRDAFALSDLGLGWAVLGGANLRLTDRLRLTVAGGIGKAAIAQFLGQIIDFSNPGVNIPLEAPLFDVEEGWGVMGGLSYAIVETTSLNFAAGYSKQEMSSPLGAILPGSSSRCALGTPCSIPPEQAFTLHANVLWQPVSHMRLGWEIMYGQYEWLPQPLRDTAAQTSFDFDTLRAQFAAWFYF